MLGTPDVLLILGLALVIFGPKKLGKAVREFRNASEDLKGNFQEEARELSTLKRTIMGEINHPTGQEITPPEVAVKAEVASGHTTSGIGDAKKEQPPEGGMQDASH